MVIEQILNSLIEEINNNIKREENIHRSLQDYEKKRLVLNIDGETNYIFKINNKEISFEKEVNFTEKHGDMHLGLSSEMAENIFKNKKVRLRDLPKIKHRNIKIQDIMIGKKII